MLLTGGGVWGVNPSMIRRLTELIRNGFSGNEIIVVECDFTTILEYYITAVQFQIHSSKNPKFVLDFFLFLNSHEFHPLI